MLSYISPCASRGFSLSFPRFMVLQKRNVTKSYSDRLILICLYGEIISTKSLFYCCVGNGLPSLMLKCQDLHNFPHSVSFQVTIKAISSDNSIRKSEAPIESVLYTMNPNSPHDCHHCVHCHKQFSLFSKRLQCSICRIVHSVQYFCSKCVTKSHADSRSQLLCATCAPSYSLHLLSPSLGREEVSRSRSDFCPEIRDSVSVLNISLNTSHPLWKSSQAPSNRTVQVTETSSYPREILLAVNSCREFTPRTVLAT